MLSRSRWLHRLLALGLIVAAVLVIPQVALAQVSIDPTATPTENDGGWVYWMAEGAIILGGLVVLVAVASYLRFAPRFFRSDEKEDGVRSGVPAPEPDAIRLQWQRPVPSAQPVAVAAAPAAVAAPAPAPAAPAPAPAPAAAPQAAPAAQAPAPAAEAPAAAPAAPPAPREHEGPIELDQETYERVLKEQLDKGTDRRVAEGRARSAALKAAREKAGG